MGSSTYDSWRDPSPGRAERGFWIFAGKDCVMAIENRPGQLISVAAPGPGGFVEHPWLHGVSRGMEHEHKLRQILLSSSDFDDFVNRLLIAGYDLANDGAEVYDITSAPQRFRRDGKLVGAFWGHPGPVATLWWEPADAPPLHTLVTCYERASAPAILNALAASKDTLSFIEALGPSFTAE